MALIDRIMNALRPDRGHALQDWLDAAADMDDKRINAYKLFRNYYDGEVGAKLRDRAREYLARFGVEFTENFCDVVVDTLAERLEVTGFKTSDAQPDGADPIAEQVWAWWQGERLDAQQGTVHTTTLIDGDGAVMVYWDDDEKHPSVERQRIDQVKFVYSADDPDDVEYACKRWDSMMVGPSNPTGLPVVRLNIYWPDRLEKWFKLDGGKDAVWTEWQDEGDPNWPVWLTVDGTETGDALGIPLVHFRHKPLGDGRGRSRVKGAISFQEQLNKYAADLNDLIDNHALPQDWVTGAPKTETIRRVPGEVWQASAVETKFGRLEASPTSNLLEAIEGVLSRLARKTRIPMHLLTGGTPPSGESLKTAESGLVATARMTQVEFGNCWEDVMRIALRLNTAFGDGTPVEPGFRIETLWANPQTRSEVDDVNVANSKKQLGVSQYTLIKELGYNPETELERGQAEAQAQAEVAAKAFDAGRVP